jgi:hypothetical protein
LTILGQVSWSRAVGLTNVCAVVSQSASEQRAPGACCIAKPIGKEPFGLGVPSYSRRANEIINPVLARALASAPIGRDGIGAAFVNFAIASLARNLILEGELGLLDAEDEIRASIAGLLRKLQPEAGDS